MTPREEALTLYFYQIASDPRMRAALASPVNLQTAVKFKDAFISCITEDVPAVLRHATGRALEQVEPAARFAAKGAAKMAMTGSMPEPMVDHIAGVAEEGVIEGLKWLRNKVAGVKPVGDRR